MWTKPLSRNLASAKLRATLVPRPEPYWTILCLGRGLGYLRLAKKKAFWVARATRRHGAGRMQHWLGRSDDFASAEGWESLSYEQATKRAWEWFQTLSAEDICDARPPGRDRNMLYSPIGDVFTIGHAMRDYIEWKRISHSEGWLEFCLTMTNCYILPQLGMVAVHDLTADIIRKLMRFTLETPFDVASRRSGFRYDLDNIDEETLRRRKNRANDVLGCLKGALNLAWETGKTETDKAWRPIKPLRNHQKPRTLYLNRAECKALIRACPPQLAQLVQAALYTGCRARELIRMRVEDVARDGYGLYVIPSKGHKQRFVFLPDEGMAFFLSLCAGKRPKDFIFLQEDGRQWRLRYDAPFKKAVIAAGLPPEFVFHGLRHTYASQLVQAGTPLIVVAEQLGHSGIQAVSTVYGHLAPQIRESEVRQRFTSISRQNSEKTQEMLPELHQLRAGLQRDDWRSYANIVDLSSRRRTE